MRSLTGQEQTEVSSSRLFLSQLPLEKQLASLESVFHSAPVGLCVFDLNFRYITVNPCFARLYHRPVAHFPGRTVEEALPIPAPQIMLQLREVVATGQTIHREITLRDPAAAADDPDPRYVTYFRGAQPVRDASGTMIGISVSVVDITAQKHAEAALRESEEDLRFTVELTPHLAWTANPEGDMTFISPRWEQVIGSKFDYTRGKSWSLAVHRDDRESTHAKWTHSVETGEPLDAEYRVRVADGSFRWMRARAYPRRGTSGEIIRWYGTVEDIHDRKLVEAALQTKTDELARRVREDHLTGLANRRRFDEALDGEVKRARRARLPLALLMIDVDHFKRFNDTWGHVAGDECLRMIASSIYSVTRRPGDLCARFGGEEFAVILPNTGMEGAREQARHALEAVANLRLPQAQQITISIGIALLDLSAGDERLDRARPLVQAADRALYQAKANGRNCVAVSGEG
jgi:diguanylate cyclase (GGDEF)-like protein/PAS domain S-box-containing protein